MPSGPGGEFGGVPQVTSANNPIVSQMAQGNQQALNSIYTQRPGQPPSTVVQAQVPEEIYDFNIGKESFIMTKEQADSLIFNATGQHIQELDPEEVKYFSAKLAKEGKITSPNVANAKELASALASTRATAIANQEKINQYTAYRIRNASHLYSYERTALKARIKPLGDVSDWLGKLGVHEGRDLYSEQRDREVALRSRRNAAEAQRQAVIIDESKVGTGNVVTDIETLMKSSPTSGPGSITKTVNPKTGEVEYTQYGYTLATVSRTGRVLGSRAPDVQKQLVKIEQEKLSNEVNQIRSGNLSGIDASQLSQKGDELFYKGYAVMGNVQSYGQTATGVATLTVRSGEQLISYRGGKAEYISRGTDYLNLEKGTAMIGGKETFITPKNVEDINKLFGTSYYIPKTDFEVAAEKVANEGATPLAYEYINMTEASYGGRVYEVQKEGDTYTLTWLLGQYSESKTGGPSVKSSFENTLKDMQEKYKYADVSVEGNKIIIKQKPVTIAKGYVEGYGVKDSGEVEITTSEGKKFSYTALAEEQQAVVDKMVNAGTLEAQLEQSYEKEYAMRGETKDVDITYAKGFFNKPTLPEIYFKSEEGKSPLDQLISFDAGKTYKAIRELPKDLAEYYQAHMPDAWKFIAGAGGIELAVTPPTSEEVDARVKKIAEIREGQAEFNHTIDSINKTLNQEHKQFASGTMTEIPDALKPKKMEGVNYLETSVPPSYDIMETGKYFTEFWERPGYAPLQDIGYFGSAIVIKPGQAIWENIEYGAEGIKNMSGFYTDHPDIIGGAGKVVVGTVGATAIAASLIIAPQEAVLSGVLFGGVNVATGQDFWKGYVQGTAFPAPMKLVRGIVAPVVGASTLGTIATQALEFGVAMPISEAAYNPREVTLEGTVSSAVSGAAIGAAFAVGGMAVGKVVKSIPIKFETVYTNIVKSAEGGKEIIERHPLARGLFLTSKAGEGPSDTLLLLTESGKIKTGVISSSEEAINLMPSVQRTYFIKDIASNRNAMAFPRSSGETAIFTNPNVMKAIGFSSENVELVKVDELLRSKLANVQSAYLAEAKFPKLISAFGTEEETKIVHDWLVDLNAKNPGQFKVGGSVGLMPQIMLEFQRVGHDIDSIVKNKAFFVDSAKDLAERMNKAGFEYTVNPEAKGAGGIIVRKATPTESLFDVHYFEAKSEAANVLEINAEENLLALSSPIGKKELEIIGMEEYLGTLRPGTKPNAYGYDLISANRPDVRVEGKIQSISLGEQAIAKSSAATKWWSNPVSGLPEIGPASELGEKTLKHAADTYAIYRTQLESLKIQGGISETEYAEYTSYLNRYRELQSRNPIAADLFKKMDEGAYKAKIDLTPSLRTPAEEQSMQATMNIAESRLSSTFKPETIASEVSYTSYTASDLVSARTYPSYSVSGASSGISMIALTSALQSGSQSNQKSAKNKSGLPSIMAKSGIISAMPKSSGPSGPSALNINSLSPGSPGIPTPKSGTSGLSSKSSIPGRPSGIDLRSPAPSNQPSITIGGPSANSPGISMPSMASPFGREGSVSARPSMSLLSNTTGLRGKKKEKKEKPKIWTRKDSIRDLGLDLRSAMKVQIETGQMQVTESSAKMFSRKQADVFDIMGAPAQEEMNMNRAFKNRTWRGM
jgi:hypothetical protein